MRRFFLYTALALYFSVRSAPAADRYGVWLLEHPQNSVVTLSFKQSVPLNNKIARSELGFICDQRDNAALVGVILIPFDETFENHQDVITVVIQTSANQNDPFDILQKWNNGTEYIFLESTDDINELASFLKAEEIDSEKSAHFFFPNDGDAGHQNSNHIVVDVLGFSDGFSAFEKACTQSQ
jgi:hypothetical protein